MLPEIIRRELQKAGEELRQLRAKHPNGVSSSSRHWQLLDRIDALTGIAASDAPQLYRNEAFASWQ